MKKVVSVLLTMAMLMSCLISTAFAAETWGGYTVSAGKSDVSVGDTVDFTVYLNDCSDLEGGVYNFQFKVGLPEGLTYVSGSGKLNADFESKTGLTSPRFNESKLKVSALGATVSKGGYTGGKIAILTFSCKVEQEGALTVGLTDAVLSDQNFASQIPAVTAAAVTASAAHEHNYGTEWEKDAAQHWHECECGDKTDEAAHSFQWVIDKEATETEDGLKHEECTVCGYAKEGVSIPALGSSDDEVDDGDEDADINEDEDTDSDTGSDNDSDNTGNDSGSTGGDSDTEADDDSDSNCGSSNSKLDDVPKTGDITIVYEMVMLAAAAAGAVICLIVKRKAAK